MADKHKNNAGLINRMREGYELYKKGRLLVRTGDYEEAISLFRRSAEMEPHFKTFELLGECLLALNRNSEAVGPLAAATTLNRGVRAPSLLAEAFLRNQKFDDAEDFAKLALQRDPRNKRARDVLEKLEANKLLNLDAAKARRAPKLPS
jgi:tetratricopeptide (TPR) repeat protein